MTSPTTPPANKTSQPERVYVEIPKAGPGQTYRAEKNVEQPLLMTLSRIFIVALCATLPAAPALIFGMILGDDPNSRSQFLWIWIPMILFIEAIAIPVAWGLAREALGSAGAGFHEGGYGKFKRP